ncbi:hypothetical protein BGZ65_000807, partial [Modicella reniformis]
KPIPTSWPIWCVVDGESTPFSVKVKSTESVDVLEEIKKEKSPRFDDIDADNSPSGSYDYQYTKHIDEETTPDNKIGARIAVSSGLIPGSFQDLKRHGRYSVDSLNIKTVIQEIVEIRLKKSGRTLDAIVIHMDEYQMFIDASQRGQKNRTWDEARQEFKLMLKEIGNVMRTPVDSSRRCIILSICTGTPAIDSKGAEYEITFKNTLARTVPRTTLAGSPGDDEVWDQLHFSIALHDTGFIPRFVSFFLQYYRLSTGNDWGHYLYKSVYDRYGMFEL